jgi:hypothetical protein
MAAMTTERNVVRAGNALASSPGWLPIKANTKILQGAVVVNDGGYAAPGRTATGLRTLGVARKTYDNTGGAAGALIVEYDEGSMFLANSGGGDTITTDHIGNLVYLVDDQTVALTDGTGTRSPAGRVTEIDATEGNWPIAVRLGAGLAA